MRIDKILILPHLEINASALTLWIKIAISVKFPALIRLRVIHKSGGIESVLSFYKTVVSLKGKNIKAQGNALGT